MRIFFVVNDVAMHERLGVMSLSAVLKKNGHQVSLILTKQNSLNKIRKLMTNYLPDVVGYSAMTGEHLDLISLNLILKKEFKFISVFGGPHATFFPQLIYEKGVDGICVGEADLVLPEFCNRVEYKEDYWTTPNFGVKYQENIFFNRLSPLIKNIDELPPVDRDLIYEAEHNLRDTEDKFFISSRGCPYHCTYCFNSKYNEIYKGLGPIIRYRSPANLIDEICEVRNRYPLRFVRLVDDTFLLKPKEWFEQFSQIYRKRVGLPFSCNIRPNVVTEEIIELLRDAGLYLVWMGCECGDEEVSNRILKRNIKNEQIFSAAYIIKKAGIKLITQNLCGMPTRNSYEVDIKTLELNFSIKPEFAWSSILLPYPGTPIETYAKDNNYLGDGNQFLYTNKYKSMLKFSSYLEKRQIENLHKLFGLLVRFPWLRPYCNLLCKLPLTRFYMVLFYLWYGYQMNFKLFPKRYSLKGLLSYLKLFFRLLRKG